MATEKTTEKDKDPVIKLADRCSNVSCTFDCRDLDVFTFCMGPPTPRPGTNRIEFFGCSKDSWIHKKCQRVTDPRLFVCFDCRFPGLTEEQEKLIGRILAPTAIVGTPPPGAVPPSAAPAPTAAAAQAKK